VAGLREGVKRTEEKGKGRGEGAVRCLQLAIGGTQKNVALRSCFALRLRQGMLLGYRSLWLTHPKPDEGNAFC